MKKIGLVVLALVLAGCNFGGEGLRPTHTRMPTNTPVPGIPTRNYVAVNQTLEAMGEATLEPGPGIETLVFVQSARTIEALLASPTPPPTITDTPTVRPTHTLRPSGTPVPGIQTEVFIAVNATLAALGSPTMTPGISREDFIATAIAATIAAPPTGQ